MEEREKPSPSSPPPPLPLKKEGQQNEIRMKNETSMAKRFDVTRTRPEMTEKTDGIVCQRSLGRKIEKILKMEVKKWWEKKKEVKKMKRMKRMTRKRRVQKNEMSRKMSFDGATS